MAAAKKDFSGMKTGKEVYKALSEATSGNRQTDASAEEQAIRGAEMRTQGRQGCKLPRINIGFTPENYQFIRIMSRATGQNMNSFLNLVVTAYRSEHPEIMEQAKSFLDTVNSGAFSAVTPGGSGTDQAEKE